MTPAPSRHDAALAALAAALEPAVLQAAPIDERHLRDWNIAAPAGAVPLALARPRTTAEVAQVLRICDAHRVPVVPQAGLTGLTGGATPDHGWVALSLERMSAIESIDPDGMTATVQAGATLQSVQEAAEAAGALFALDIGARGSCRVGGNASTNAGGNRVLRFGMMRELILGLEAVLPDGTVIDAMNAMLKNNAGYDLKQLFIGSEGTLGVVTRLVLRLHPMPRSTCTALVAVPDYGAALRLLRLARERFGPTLSAFEAMWPDFYAFAAERLGGAPLPARGDALHVLVETMGTDPAHDAAQFEAAIGAAIEDGVASDAVVAQSERERRALWRVRDQSAELRRWFGPHVDYDVSLPVATIGAYVPEVSSRLRAGRPGVGLVFFGHVADGNLHLGVQVREGALSKDEADAIVYGAVADWRGSISAEHGIGLLKKAYLGHSRGEAEIALMRRLKAALDPNGILNPGKVF
ncbi:MAG TPA: FAD-binding oxidoreductase [Burkholderiaceae bacterium]|nr:FAD-binding oxidoreductase [Burkholderiaceae bacterium]